MLNYVLGFVSFFFNLLGLALQSKAHRFVFIYYYCIIECFLLRMFELKKNKTTTKLNEWSSLKECKNCSSARTIIGILLLFKLEGKL